MNIGNLDLDNVAKVHQEFCFKFDPKSRDRIQWCMHKAYAHACSHLFTLIDFILIVHTFMIYRIPSTASTYIYIALKPMGITSLARLITSHVRTVYIHVILILMHAVLYVAN